MKKSSQTCDIFSISFVKKGKVQKVLINIGHKDIVTEKV